MQSEADLVSSRLLSLPLVSIVNSAGLNIYAHLPVIKTEQGIH